MDGLDARGVDHLDPANGVGEGHYLDPAAVRGGHLAELAPVDQLRRVPPELDGQDAVEGAGGAAPLDVAQHDGARFDARALLDELGQVLADASQLDVAEGIEALVLCDRPALALTEGGTLADGDDGVTPPVGSRPGLDHPEEAVEVDGLLGQENGVGATGDAGVPDHPTRVAAHDLHHQTSVVRAGGGVEAVDGLRGDGDGGVEPYGELGGIKVVVDGLGAAYGGHAQLGQPVEHPQGVLASDAHEGIDTQPLEGLAHPLGSVVNLEHIGP